MVRAVNRLELQHFDYLPFFRSLYSIDVCLLCACRRHHHRRRRRFARVFILFSLGKCTNSVATSIFCLFSALENVSGNFS